MKTQNGFQGSVNDVVGLTQYSETRRFMPNIEDAVSGVVNCWSIDPLTLTRNPGTSNIVTVPDRVSGLAANVVTQGVDANRPVLAYSQALGVPTADFGTVVGTAKLLTGTTVAPINSPYTIGAVFEQNVPLAGADSARIIGNSSGADRFGEIATDVANNRWLVYNGGSGIAFDYYDWSYVGPLALLVTFDMNQGVQSRGMLIRGDGRFWHTEGLNVLSGGNSGTMAFGGFGAAGTQGYPGKYAEVFRLGRTMRQQDYAAFIGYLNTKYGIAVPRNQVILDGDSLCVSQNTWTKAIYANVPRAHAWYVRGISGRRISEMTSDMRVTFTEGTCGYASGQLVYVADGGTNDVIQNLSYAAIMANQQARINRARALGANIVVLSNIMAIGNLTALQESTRKAVNRDLKETWAARGINKLVNVADTEPIDQQSCPAGLLDPNNGVFFMPDKVHLTPVGYVLFGGQFTQRLNEVL